MGGGNIYVGADERVGGPYQNTRRKIWMMRSSWRIWWTGEFWYTATGEVEEFYVLRPMGSCSNQDTLDELMTDTKMDLFPDNGAEGKAAISIGSDPGRQEKRWRRSHCGFVSDCIIVCSLFDMLNHSHSYNGQDIFCLEADNFPEVDVPPFGKTDNACRIEMTYFFFFYDDLLDLLWLWISCSGFLFQQPWRPISSFLRSRSLVATKRFFKWIFICMPSPKNKPNAIENLPKGNKLTSAFGANLAWHLT